MKAISGRPRGRVAAPTTKTVVKESIRSLEELEQTYRENLDSVLRICRSFLGDPMDAEDAAQETFIRFARRATPLSDDPVAYLAAVARNVCRDELKRRAQRAAIVADSPAADETIENRYLSIALTRSVWNRLNGRDRQLFAHVFAGYRYHETAARTGMSPQAVSVGLTRARERARKALRGATAPALLPIADLRRWMAGRRRATGTVAPSNLELLQALGLRAALVGAVVGGSFGMMPGIPAAGQAPTQQATVSTGALALPAAAALPAGPAERTARTTSPEGTTAEATARQASAASIANGLVAPATGATPADAQFTSLTASPRYDRDHTVYASGILISGCSRPTCPVVFRSNDGAASWKPLDSVGFAGGDVMLPPEPALDSSIFAIGAAGVQQSTDGGRSFLTVVPGVPSAAIAPDSAPGHARVLVGTSPMAVYDAATHAVTAGPALPPGTFPPAQLAYAGDSGTVVAAASRVNPLAPSSLEAVVLVCPTGEACRQALVIPESAEVQVLVSPTYAVDHTVFAHTHDRVFVSRDGGRVFAPLGVDFAGRLALLAASADLASSHRLISGLAGTAGRFSPLGVMRDDGSSLGSLGAAGLPAGLTVAAVLPLPGGRILVGMIGGTSGAAFGIRCSNNQGLTWQQSC